MQNAEKKEKKKKKKKTAVKGTKKITYYSNYSYLMKLCEILSFPGTISHLALFLSARIHNFHNITE